MLLFIPLNVSDSYLVKELNMREMNKDTIKHTIAAFIKPLDSAPKE